MFYVYGLLEELPTAAAAVTVVSIPLPQITPLPKHARAFPTQATQFAVPPPAAAASGTLATTEAKDIAAFTGSGAAAPPLFGWYQPLSVALKRAKAQPTQATQFAVPAPIAGISGSWATTEAPDIAAFAGTFAALPQFIPLLSDAGGIRPRYVYYQALVNPLRPPSIAGILAVTEAPDTASFTASYAVTGILTTIEGQDVASFTGSGVAPSGTLAVTEAPDGAAFTGNFVVSGILAVTEAQDTASFAGTVSLAATGTLAVTEAPDIPGFTGTVIGVPVGQLVTTEAKDNVVFLIDYMPPPVTTSASPYPSRWDYGWFDRRPPLRRGHGPGR